MMEVYHQQGLRPCTIMAHLDHKYPPYRAPWQEIPLVPLNVNKVLGLLFSIFQWCTACKSCNLFARPWFLQNFLTPMIVPRTVISGSKYWMQTLQKRNSCFKPLKRNIFQVPLLIGHGKIPPHVSLFQDLRLEKGHPASCKLCAVVANLSKIPTKFFGCCKVYWFKTNKKKLAIYLLIMQDLKTPKKQKRISQPKNRQFVGSPKTQSCWYDKVGLEHCHDFVRISAPGTGWECWECVYVRKRKTSRSEKIILDSLSLSLFRCRRKGFQVLLRARLGHRQFINKGPSKYHSYLKRWHLTDILGKYSIQQHAGDSTPTEYEVIL